MADDKIKPAGAADQEQGQEPAADNQRQKPRATIELDLKDATYLPGESKPAEEMIKAVAGQKTDRVISILNFARTLDSKAIVADLLTQLLDLADEMKELEPYLTEELQKPEYAGKSFADLAEQTEDGTTLFTQAVKAAQEVRAADKGKTLRTVARAGEVQRITSDRLAIPTADNFLNALSLYEQGQAYLSVMRMDGLTFDSGRLYFEDGRARAVSEMELQDLKTKESIENINLPFLQFYYSQLFSEWEKAVLDQATDGVERTIPKITRFYLPDIARARGLSSNAGRESIEAIKNDIAAFHNVVGVFKVDGYKSPSYYPVLNFEGYDTETNTISISSPYLLHIVEEIYRISVRRYKDGTPRLKKNGTPLQKPVNSYLIHSDIQKERNKTAVQNVILLVQGIEKCGENTYTIKASTLIKRNPVFMEQLKNNKNKNRLLERVFTKTWELLRNKTSLLDKYINIELPDPKNPACIPKYSQLDSFVIAIKHDGKKKNEK